MTEPHIEELTTFKSSVVTGIQQLLKQLSSTEHPFGEKELKELVAHPDSHLLLLYEGEALAGMLTLTSYISPTGRKWWLEDVVIEKACRGRHWGKEFIEYAIRYAKEHGGGTLMLTSNPKRIAANGLYQSLLFQQKETNVYKMKL